MIKYENNELSVKGSGIDIMSELTATIVGIYEMFYEHNPATADMFKNYLFDEDGLTKILEEKEKFAKDKQDGEKSIQELFNEIDVLIKDINGIIKDKNNEKKEDK